MAKKSRSRVRVDQPLMANVLDAIHSEGIASSFTENLKDLDTSLVLENHNDRLVYSINRRTFKEMRDFVRSNPILRHNPSISEFRDSDDDPNFVRL